MQHAYFQENLILHSRKNLKYIILPHPSSTGIIGADGLQLFDMLGAPQNGIFNCRRHNLDANIND